MPSENRELEVKILSVDIEITRKKLERIGAVFIGDSIQQIYTYDIHPINATYESLLWSLHNTDSEKVRRISIERLKILFFDLNDLLSDDEKNTLCIITNTEDFISFLESIGEIKLIDLKHPDFVKIVRKYETHPNKWVRLRKQNDSATLAVKQIFNRKESQGIRHHSIQDVTEIEIEVGDFEKTRLLLEQMGFFYKNYQEKRRISYLFENEITIDIDQWPLIPPYLEIEAKDRRKIFQVVELLGFKEQDTKIMNTDDVFSLYGLDMYAYPELKFTERSPDTEASTKIS